MVTKAGPTTRDQATRSQAVVRVGVRRPPRPRSAGEPAGRRVHPPGGVRIAAIVRRGIARIIVGP